MDDRLRGNGNYTIEQTMASSSYKEDWYALEQLLAQDYPLQKVIIENSKTKGWGINYRVNKHSLCYIHPEKNGLYIAFQIQE